MAEEFPNAEILLGWMQEREAIRLKREAGELPPVSTDPVFQTASFCNVRREDDRVTRWLRDHWREPYRDDLDCWFSADGRALHQRARGAWRHHRAVALEPRPIPRRDGGAQSARSTARAGGLYDPRRPERHAEIRDLARHIFDPLWNAREAMRPRLGGTCQEFFERLLAFDDLGTFLAAQIVADTKHTPPLDQASDWRDFVASGPGSRRGLNIVMGRDAAASWTETAWRQAFDRLSEAIAPKLAELGFGDLDAQDRQNCLCETFKLWRARTTGRMPRRKYAGTGDSKPAAPKRPAALMMVTAITATACPHAMPELAAARDPEAAHILFHDLETRSAVDLKALAPYHVRRRSVDRGALAWPTRSTMSRCSSGRPAMRCRKNSSRPPTIRNGSRSRITTNLSG